MTKQDIENWYASNKANLKSLKFGGCNNVVSSEILFENELEILKIHKETNKQYINAIDRLTNYINEFKNQNYGAINN